MMTVTTKYSFSVQNSMGTYERCDWRTLATQAKVSSTEAYLLFSTEEQLLTSCSKKGSERVILALQISPTQALTQQPDL